MDEESLQKAYHSIGEVSRITGVKQHVLRYWESEFKLLRPSRRESGQRKYTLRDIELVKHIRELLYERRLTLEGAKQELLREKRSRETQPHLELEKEGAAVGLLREVKQVLLEVLKLLD